MKSFHIRRFSGQHFPAFGLNTEDQKNSKYGHFLRPSCSDRMQRGTLIYTKENADAVSYTFICEKPEEKRYPRIKVILPFHIFWNWTDKYIGCGAIFPTNTNGCVYKLWQINKSKNTKQRCIQHHIKHLRWNLLQKELTTFSR